MGGGDLLNLLIEKDVFEEDFARFYVAEVRFYRTCLTAALR
jgi:serine/threonine-protein kinase LATS1/2